MTQTKQLLLKLTNIILAIGLSASCANRIISSPTQTAETSIPPTPTAAADVPVHVWLTASNQTKLLEPQPDISFKSNVSAEGKKIYINENHLYQQMDGFGASMTDSSAWLIYTQLNEILVAGIFL